MRQRCLQAHRGREEEKNGRRGEPGRRYSGNNNLSLRIDHRGHEKGMKNHQGKISIGKDLFLDFEDHFKRNISPTL